MAAIATNTAGRLKAAGLLSLGLAAAGCTSEARTPDASAPAPPAVKVALAHSKDIPLETNFTGRVEPVDRVELRPRVGGAIDAVLFREGEAVAAGAPLFRIDQRPYQLAVRRARAQVTTVQARLDRARQELARAEQLAKADAVAIEELERRRAEVGTLEGELEAAQAAAADAELQLDFTVVRAPVAGRVGRAELTAGNLVSGGPGASRLAVLQSTDPIYVYFDVDPATAERARRTKRSEWRATVSTLGDEIRVLSGPVDFVDTGVGDQTGTLKLRARIGNPRGDLVPAAVVRVAFRHGTAANAVLVPDLAIGTEQGVRHVLVAADDGTVEYRPVSPGTKVGSWRVITDARVTAGERIVLPGMPGLRPGMKITPVEEVVR
jgi:multidrug efflux system membrane fusion protein